MALKGVSYPSGGSATNMVFVEDRMGSALGNCLFDQAPVLAAISKPKDWIYYCNDFVETVDGWTTTGTTGSVMALDTASTSGSATIPGGYASLTEASNLSTAQMRALCVNLHATKIAWLEFTIAIDTASTADLAVGLMVAGKVTASTTAPTDGLWFEVDSADANIDILSRSASGTANDNDSLSDLVTATYVTLGIKATSTLAEYYINGVLTRSYTTQIPATTIDLCPLMTISSASATRTLSVDLVQFLQAK